MPLLSVENVAPGVRLGIWKTVETVDEFFAEYPCLSFLKPKVLGFDAEQRRIEVLAVCSLLHGMGITESLLHDGNGKPLFASGLNVSVSHTKGCVAVIISGQSKVAVDIEYQSDRVGRVAKRLLRSDEKAAGLRELMLHWCGKETLYKLYSEEHLALEDMRLVSIDGGERCGVIEMENVQRGETLDVCYRFFDGFVLTYAVL